MDGFDDEFPYLPAFQAVDLETDQDVAVTLGKTPNQCSHSILFLYFLTMHLDVFASDGFSVSRILPSDDFHNGDKFRDFQSQVACS